MLMNSYHEVIEELLKSQNRKQLSIIKLSEPLSVPLLENTGERRSDVSAEALEIPTPASLEADLVHYKELFSKLRFSYLEQVTKEKFIRAIVGDPPLVVEHQENVELEASLAVSKAALKTQKTEVEELVTELEKRGRDLCLKHQSIKMQTAQLQRLPQRIEELQAKIDKLKATQQPEFNPVLNMPLEKTVAMVEERLRERAELDRQLEQLQLMVPRKARELERLHAELQPLEAKRISSTSLAKEAKRRKEQALGGVGDDLEERGRWWRSVNIGLEGMIGLEH